jgi:hypothetical protein
MKLLFYCEESVRLYGDTVEYFAFTYVNEKVKW